MLNIYLIYDKLVLLLTNNSGFFMNRIDSAYYFAYGSNMNYERVVERMNNGYKDMSEDGIIKEDKTEFYEKINKIGACILFEYELCFNKMRSNSTVFEGFANIVPQKGATVEGVLYELNQEQLKILDYYEGVEDNHYIRANVEVKSLESGKVYDGVTVYVAHESRIDNRCKPSKTYLNHLIKGSKEFNLDNLTKKLEKYPRLDD